MNYFARIIKHYITLALERSGVPIDGDTRTELNDAFNDLDNHIRIAVAEQIKQHIEVMHSRCYQSQQKAESNAIKPVLVGRYPIPNVAGWDDPIDSNDVLEDSVGG